MKARSKILAAIDLGPATDAVLARALDEADVRGGAELYVLMVATPTTLGMGVVAPAIAPTFRPDLDLDKPVVEVHRAIGAFREGRPDHPLPRVEVHVTMGRPEQEIVWLAAHLGVDLLVVGSHNRHGLKRALLGSVSEKVVRSAGCPVLVVREKAHDVEGALDEALCPDCRETRLSSGGAELWCGEHRARHLRVLHAPTSPT
ncbi:MAG: universal stress protein [Polyangiaceae bacterium]|jgi:nucleotide-binding universal stress UspA family protein|nr:universal stress protein [Polyangiaceae bacterium]MBK8940191.1 universal stress protein [Polyangiaceae bacterium]